MKIKRRAICGQCARFHDELVSFSDGPYLCASCQKPPPNFWISVIAFGVLVILIIVCAVVFGE